MATLDVSDGAVCMMYGTPATAPAIFHFYIYKWHCILHKKGEGSWHLIPAQVSSKLWVSQSGSLMQVKNHSRSAWLQHSKYPVCHDPCKQCYSRQGCHPFTTLHASSKAWPKARKSVQQRSRMRGESAWLDLRWQGNCLPVSAGAEARWEESMEGGIGVKASSL